MKQCCQPIFPEAVLTTDFFAASIAANRFFSPDAVLPTYFSVLQKSVLPT
jgi:hypothetical protein